MGWFGLSALQAGLYKQGFTHLCEHPDSLVPKLDSVTIGSL